MESTGRTSPTIKPDAFDVFTELDPLGTGRSKPYVDKKDFFQELKNPPKKILNQYNTNEIDKNTESSLQNLPTKSVSNSFSSDLSFKETSSIIEDPFKNDNFNKSHDSNSAEIEFADFSSFESLKPVSPHLPQKSPLFKSDSSSSQNSVQGLLKVSLLPETQKPYNVSTSPKYNLMSKNKTKLKMRKSPSPDYYRNEEPTSPDDDYAIMKLMTLPQRLDIAPEPPPRPSSSLEPPPLPPKKQQIPSKNAKPIRSHNSHYDYIENYVSSYNIPSTQQESEAPPLPLPSRKPKNEIKKKKDLDSEYYLVPVSVEKTNSESKSSISTSLDITLSQLTKTGFSDLADTLKISPTSLSKMTLKELTLYLSKLEQSSSTNNEETQSASKKTEEDKKESEKSLYDKYAVFRELLGEEKTCEVVPIEDDKYAALRDIPVKEPHHKEETTEDLSVEKTSETCQSNNVSDQAEIKLVKNNHVFELEDKKLINEVIETKNDEEDKNENDEMVKKGEEVEHYYEEDNRVVQKELAEKTDDSEVSKENVSMVKDNTELFENNAHQKLFDNSQCWATFDAEPQLKKKVNSPWSASHQESQISKPKVNMKKELSNRSKCSSSWDDCEESEDNWDNAKRSLESSIEDFPRTVNGWSDGESMYEDEPYYEKKPNRRSNRKISPRRREPSPWDEGNRYSDEWESPYMIPPPHWRVPHVDDERRRSSKDDKRRIYARPDIDRRIQKLPSTPNWEDEKYKRHFYERRRRYLEEQYNWDRYGPPIPKGFKNYPRPPIDISDEDDVKMRYRLPKKNRYVSSTTPRKPRRSYHRRSDGSDEERNIPPRKPYSQEELDLSESELDQHWSRKTKNKRSLKRNETSPFDDNFTPESPDSALFAKTMSTCSDLGYLTKPSPSTSSKTNKITRRPKRSDSGHRSIDSNSKSEAAKRSPFDDNFTPDNVAKSSMSSEFSFKDDDVFAAKDIKTPHEEVSSSPKEMKKSESINIFSRNADPFEDDDFFSQEVSIKPNLASLEEASSDHEVDEEWNKQPDRTKNE